MECAEYSSTRRNSSGRDVAMVKSRRNCDARDPARVRSTTGAMRAAVTRLACLFVFGIVIFSVHVGSADSQRTAVTNLVPLRAPDEKTIPGGPVGAAIRYGKKVLTETQSYAKAYVGNGLNCSSCHLDAGRKAYASPWVGLWGVFPEYRSRNGQVNACKTESMTALSAR